MNFREKAKKVRKLMVREMILHSMVNYSLILSITDKFPRLQLLPCSADTPSCVSKDERKNFRL